jgi:hypothetical protein
MSRSIGFPVGGRIIDILAVDKGGRYVVIELKVSRGYDRVVGSIPSRPVTEESAEFRGPDALL